MASTWGDTLGSIDWRGSVVNSVPAVVGTYVAGKANQRAGRALADSNAAAAQAMQAGNAAAQQRYDAMAERTLPAVNYLRNVVSDTGLTPGQQQRIADTRRQTASQLSSRLGGRSATAIATRAAKNLEDSIYGANRSRSDQAASMLTGQNVSAMNAGASQDANLGTNLGNIAVRGGENAAGAELATGQLQGEMIGNVISPIRSVIAEERKGAYPTKGFGSR